MNTIAQLPPQAFDKADPAPDALFYAAPRLVTHIDGHAIDAVTALYRQVLPEGGRILDLMSSWVSHLPPEASFAQVTGHGLNAIELAENPRLDDCFVQDLNAKPLLPLASQTYDAACMCVSVQYLQRPIEVFTEIARVLRPGAPVVVTFSNRCFPTKAVAIWHALNSAEQQQLVRLYLERSGFATIETSEILPDTGDPIWAVIGRVPQAELA